MNANELADELETGGLIEFFDHKFQFWKRSKVIEAINMLRQQQAEIEALKARLEKAERLLGVTIT